MYEGILGVKKTTFGLDIGHETMKVVQVKGKKNNFRLIGASEINIPAASLTKEGLKNKQEIAQAIRQAVKTAKPHGISAKIVAAGLPESLFFTKSLDLPKMSLAEINKNIPYQVNEFFPLPPEETYMDWQITEIQEKGSVEVLVVAAPKVIVDSLVETVKLAGFELMGLETKPVAVARALVGYNDMNPYIIVDIGAENSGLTCLDKGVLKLTSTVSFGGNQIAKDPESTLKNLASEIVHSMKYYQNRVGQAQVFRKVILAGGGASIENVPAKIENLTKIKTEISQPMVKLTNYHPRFATAIGLAMKEISR